MIALIQRVCRSLVAVDNKIVGEIGKGLNILLGVKQGDTIEDAKYLAKKVSDLRIFEDKNNKMNLSVKDIGGDILIIPQFTLLADCKKGNRPSFTNAEQPDIAKYLYKEFINLIDAQGIKTQEGVFGADMTVEIINDGPVTIIIDSNMK
jgi:D-tyrosyl-tRNA(Tyr) deacylase